MAARPYRLPRKYRYRPRRQAGSREALAVAGAVIALAAAAGHHAAAGSRGIAAAGIGSVPPAGGGEDAFSRAVLADLGAPATPADIRSLAAWYRREWPAWPPGAAGNPLDTTLSAPGSWNFNTFGGGLHVQGYPTAAEGAQATARTLAAGYPLIVAALRSGRGLCGDPSLSAGFLTWSGGGYSGVC